MELLLEIFGHALMGLSQMCVTALWETKDPKIIAKRNACLTVYGLAFVIFVVGLILFVFKAISLILFFSCLGLMTILLFWAGHLADQIEKLVLQQKNPGPTTGGEEISAEL